MEKQKNSGFIRTAAVFYGILTALYTIILGGLVLGWIMFGMTGIVVGSFGLLALHAVFIIMFVVLTGCVVMLLHGTLLLWGPVRSEKTLYFLYQGAAFSFSVIGFCGGLLLNASGLMGVFPSFLYYIVMTGFPIICGVAFGKKRGEEEILWEQEISRENEQMEYGIRGIQGDYEGSFFPLKPDEELILGTDPGSSHVLFHDPRISRCHCVIKYWSADGNYYVMDRSTNGTFLLDGTRLPYQRAVVCAPGTVLSIAKGSQMFQFI